ncbi:MAG: hypothetical protein ACK42D_02445 [Candidatus Paceibacteria bacterium]
MPNTSQSSFIPKNNLPNRQKVGRRYNFFFISLVVYGLFIATPIASAVVFIYEKHTNNVINQTTRNLDTAIKSFSESDMLTVQQFDNRLIASSEVLESSVPLNNLLQFFLQNTPRTVSFTGIQVDSAGDGTVAVTAEVASESFDYVLFYRDELLRNSAFTSSAISNVTYQGVGDSQNESPASNQSSTEQTTKLSYQVTFTAPIAFFAALESSGVEAVSSDILLDSTNNQ